MATLQQERLATLQQARSIAQRQFASGTGTLEQIERVDHLLVEAELAMATTPNQRAEVLDNAIKGAKEQEAIAQKRANVGAATALEPLEAKAYRLGLEIRRGEAGERAVSGRSSDHP